MDTREENTKPMTTWSLRIGVRKSWRAELFGEPAWRVTVGAGRDYVPQRHLATFRTWGDAYAYARRIVARGYAEVTEPSPTDRLIMQYWNTETRVS